MSNLLRHNPIMEKLRNNQVVSCVKINLCDSRVTEIAALNGFDCVWLDMEHVPNSIRDLEHCVRSAQAYGIDAIIRVSRGSYSDIISPLELDAAGIMVPHVMSPDDAKGIARISRFHPIGLRPMDGGSADGGYCKAETKAYLKHANDQKLVIAQIEDPEAIESLDLIAQVEGIDMLFFGPGDYTHALGIPGEYNDPRVLEARRKVAEVAKKYGKYAGTVGSESSIPQLIQQGYRFISTGADVVGLGEYFSRLSAAFSNEKNSNSNSNLYK